MWGTHLRQVTSISHLIMFRTHTNFLVHTVFTNVWSIANHICQILMCDSVCLNRRCGCCDESILLMLQGFNQTEGIVSIRRSIRRLQCSTSRNVDRRRKSYKALIASKAGIRCMSWPGDDGWKVTSHINSHLWCTKNGKSQAKCKPNRWHRHRSLAKTVRGGALVYRTF